MYINIITLEYPLSAKQIMAQYPNISFPSDNVSRDSIFIEYGYYRVTLLEEPEYNSATHRISQHKNPILQNNQWVLGWDIIPLTQEEINSYTSDWRNKATATPRQLRLALLDFGMLDLVEQIIETAPRSIKIEWEYSVLYERKNPAWEELGQLTEPQITAEQIDEIFKHAATK